MWEKKSHISDFICFQCTCTYPVQCTCNNRISDLKFIRSQIYTLSGGKKQRSIIKRKQASCYCIFKQNFYNGQFIWSAAPQSTFEGKDRRTSYTHTHTRTDARSPSKASNTHKYLLNLSNVNIKYRDLILCLLLIYPTEYITVASLPKKKRWLYGTGRLDRREMFVFRREIEACHMDKGFNLL